MSHAMPPSPRRRSAVFFALAACGAGLLSVVVGCPGGTGTAPNGSGSGRGDTSASDSAAYTAPAEEKFDPIKENGPIFRDWAKPKWTLVFTGEQQGYFEPCGCTGPGRQKGGMSRRHSFLKQLAADGWNPVPIDLGGLSRGVGKQAAIKLRTSIDALEKMNYQAVGLAGEDVRFPAEDLLSTMPLDPSSPVPFVSANVTVFGGNDARFRVFEVAGVKLGVTSVLAGKFRDDLLGAIDPETSIEDPAEALRQIMPRLKEAACDHLILLSYAPPDVSKDLAKQFPEFDYVVSAGGPELPPLDATTLPDSQARLIQLGHKGMHAVVMGFYDGAAPKYQSVPLDSRFADSPEMHELMVSYQDQLKSLGWEELGVSASLHERAKGADDPDATFVGADVCGKCHAQAYGVWKGSKHSHATESLTKLDPARQFDPECISCHATGWGGKQYTPFVGGFESIAATPLLAGNGCENCHGPGSGHVAAEAARDPKRREQMRSLMRLNLAIAEQKVCYECHDHDNSPTFNFETYWEKIKHPGKQ